MTDSTSTSQPPVSSPAASRRRFLRWAAIATAVAALGAVIGLKAYAHVGGFGGWHRGGFMGAHLDPAHLDAHLDRMLKHFYVEIDATEAQKQALAPIVKSAARDLVPLHDRLHAARDQAVALLTQPTIDRTAIESLRANQLALAEQASKRLAQALADVADVLTPEQRKALAEHMARRHGPRG
jgi:periplasmic protein CpxP/Spy